MQCAEGNSDIVAKVLEKVSVSPSPLCSACKISKSYKLIEILDSD